MRRISAGRVLLPATLLAFVFGWNEAHAGLSVAIVASDPSYSAGAQTALMATGLFSSVTLIDSYSSTPTLAQLTPYSAILSYTNTPPADSTALGNVLAAYVNQGGKLELSTYSFSPPYGVGGQILTHGYSPLMVGTNGDVSGNLVATQPSNPIFNGINLSTFTYFHNSNFAQPILDSGATLLATDGAGVNMIAENASKTVLGVNLFPGSISTNANNAAFYSLLGNGLVSLTTPALVPEPSSLILTGFGLVAFAGIARRRRRALSA